MSDIVVMPVVNEENKVTEENKEIEQEEFEHYKSEKCPCTSCANWYYKKYNPKSRKNDHDDDCPCFRCCTSGYKYRGTLSPHDREGN